MLLYAWAPVSCTLPFALWLLEVLAVLSNHAQRRLYAEALGFHPPSVNVVCLALPQSRTPAVCFIYRLGLNTLPASPPLPHLC